MDFRKDFTVRSLLMFSLVCFLLVTSVLASHFRGGLISWRAVDPDNFDGNIEITHRVAWRRSNTYCDANTSSTVLLSGGNLGCRSGCSGNLGSMSFYCTDYSVSEDWTSGERTYTTNIGTNVTSFEASFASCCWISAVSGGSWEMRVKGDLSVRADTGRVNTSPVSATQPIIRLQYNCPRTITIPVQDADGDVVRCRWSSSSQSECAGVCNAFSYGTLDGNACTLTYNGSGASNGWYAVALQIEDFATSSSTTTLSSVPLQFLVNTFNSPLGCGTNQAPTFVDNLDNGACVGVAYGTQFSQRIIAQAGSNSTMITNIQTVSPLGFTKSALTRISGTQQWYIDVTWTPSSTQTGPQIFCYQAFDNTYQSSEQQCITLLRGGVPSCPSNVVAVAHDSNDAIIVTWQQPLNTLPFTSISTTVTYCPTSSPNCGNSVTCTSPCTISGLNPGTEYLFIVIPNSNCGSPTGCTGNKATAGTARICPKCPLQPSSTVEVLLTGTIPTAVLLLVNIISVVVVFLITRHCYKNTSQKSPPSKAEDVYEQLEGPMTYEGIVMTISPAYSLRK